LRNQQEGDGEIDHQGDWIPVASITIPSFAAAFYTIPPARTTCDRHFSQLSADLSVDLSRS
jgi:hypothetical protein